MPRSRIDREPSALRIAGTPILATMAGSMMPLLPVIATAPTMPPFGLLMFIAWRLRHRTLWPIWIGLPLGLWDDMFSGQPIGSSMLLWTLVMLGLDIIDRRMVWRDFWQDWGLAALLCMLVMTGGLLTANAAGGSTAWPIIAPQILMTIALFPVMSRLCAAIDYWRLYR